MSKPRVRIYGMRGDYLVFAVLLQRVAPEKNWIPAWQNQQDGTLWVLPSKDQLNPVMAFVYANRDVDARLGLR